jgi:hypothetical protein
VGVAIEKRVKTGKNGNLKARFAMTDPPQGYPAKQQRSGPVFELAALLAKMERRSSYFAFPYTSTSV